MHVSTLRGFQRQRGALRYQTRRVAVCLEAAADAHEGHQCLADYLSVLPHDMVAKALRRGLDDSADRTSVAKDATELADSLRGCVDVAGAWAGAIFCLEDLIANIPRAIVSAAVRSAKAHPQFDYTTVRAQGARDTAAFSSCVHHATDVKTGTECLSAFLEALPYALSSRAVKVGKRLPAPTGKSARLPPERRAQQLAKCMSAASASDAAVYCLADYLRTVPVAQVSQVSFALTHRILWSCRRKGDARTCSWVCEKAGGAVLDVSRGHKGRAQRPVCGRLLQRKSSENSLPPLEGNQAESYRVHLAVAVGRRPEALEVALERSRAIPPRRLCSAVFLKWTSAPRVFSTGLEHSEATPERLARPPFIRWRARANQG